MFLLVCIVDSSWNVDARGIFAEGDLSHPEFSCLRKRLGSTPASGKCYDRDLVGMTSCDIECLHANGAGGAENGDTA